MDFSDAINQVIYVAQALVLLGIAVRVIFCCIKLQHETQEAETYKKRIKNSFVIAIAVLLIFTIYDTILYYYH